MRVLLRIRGDVDRFPGGDYVQLLETKAALEKLDVTCTVAPGLGKVEGQFDVVHLFNTTRIHETYLQFCAAKAKGLPVVLSPIWHSLEDMAHFYGKIYHFPFFPINAYLATKEFFYARRSGLPISFGATFKFRSLQKLLLQNCDALLPNSETELSVLTQESRAQPRATFLSPLGIKIPKTSSTTASERRDITCAGRIEPRKNQLSVVRAFKRLPRDGRRLRIFGRPNASHPGYTKAVLSECVSGWVEYGGSISQGELMSVFQESKVVVLVSFFETFGLTALEGLACGAQLCLSATAYNRGIYADRAVYANPYSVKSITTRIADALARPSNCNQSFLNNYTWEKAAITTLAAYKYVAGV